MGMSATNESYECIESSVLDRFVCCPGCGVLDAGLFGLLRSSVTLVLRERAYLLLP